MSWDIPRQPRDYNGVLITISHVYILLTLSQIQHYIVHMYSVITMNNVLMFQESSKGILVGCFVGEHVIGVLIG